MCGLYKACRPNDVKYVRCSVLTSFLSIISYYSLRPTIRVGTFLILQILHIEIFNNSQERKASCNTNRCIEVLANNPLPLMEQPIIRRLTVTRDCETEVWRLI